MSKQGRYYAVILDKQPQRAMQRLPKNLVARIDRAILALDHDPRPPGCKKLVG